MQIGIRDIAVEVGNCLLKGALEKYSTGASISTALFKRERERLFDHLYENHRFRTLLAADHFSPGEIASFSYRILILRINNTRGWPLHRAFDAVLSNRHGTVLLCASFPIYFPAIRAIVPQGGTRKNVFFENHSR